MKITQLIFIPGFLFLAACGDAVPKKQGVLADTVQQEGRMADSDSVALLTAESKPQQKIVIDKVLNLLKKENLGGTIETDLWDNAIKDGAEPTTNNVVIVKTEEGKESHTMFEVGAFLNPDGTYQVLLFENGGLDFFPTSKSWSFVYDGVKLTPNKIELPVPKYTDLLDEVCYYGIGEKDVVNKIKSGSLKYPQYVCNDNKLKVYTNFPEELECYSEEYVGLTNKVRALYQWDGEKFVFIENQAKAVIGYREVGNIQVGSRFRGGLIDGYEMKAVGSNYEYWRNGQKIFSVFTQNGIVKSIDVFSGMFTEDAPRGLTVGDDLNTIFADLHFMGEIEKNDDTWVFNVSSERGYVVNAEDVVEVTDRNEHSKKIVFKSNATLKAIRIL